MFFKFYYNFIESFKGSEFVDMILEFLFEIVMIV